MFPDVCASLSNFRFCNNGGMFPCRLDRRVHGGLLLLFTFLAFCVAWPSRAWRVKAPPVAGC